MKAMLISIFWAATAIAAWPEGTEPFATAILESKSGSKVIGTIDFGRSDTELLIRAYVKNIEPGLHGFHVHEVGDCSDPDAKSAGDHFNPGREKHGSPHGVERHLGDFGNLKIPKGKLGFVEMRIPNPAKGPSWDSIIGKSIVIHATRDDLVTQPSGNSGARIACGIIKSSKD